MTRIRPREIDLNFILNRMRQGWHTPLSLVCLFVLFTLFTMWGSKPVYLVEMDVIPAPTSQQDTGLSVGGSVGSLLGIGLGQTGGDYVRYQRLMYSPAVAKRMQDHYGMLQLVFADQWDKKNKRWVAPPTLRAVLFGWLFDLANVPIWTPPDATTLATYLSGTIDIIPSPTTDIIHVSMADHDVAFAKKLMLAANIETNDLLKEQVSQRARQQVAYLQDKLNQTSVADYRATLLALLSSQEKTLMLTQTRAAYAAEIVSPPMASPVPVSPRPLRSILVAVLVGILAGFSLVIFLGPDWWRSPLNWMTSLTRRDRREVARAAPHA